MRGGEPGDGLVKAAVPLATSLVKVVVALLTASGPGILRLNPWLCNGELFRKLFRLSLDPSNRQGAPLGFRLERFASHERYELYQGSQRREKHLKKLRPTPIRWRRIYHKVTVSGDGLQNINHDKRHLSSSW